MPPAALLDRAARLLGRAAAIFLVAMMLVTVVDVGLRWLVNFPVFGTFDLVELFLVATIFLAIPETFLRDEHVVVDVVDRVAGPRTIAVLRTISAGLALVFLTLMLAYMIRPAWDSVAFHDVTLDLEIPKIVHWTLILAGTGCSVLCVAAVFVRDLAGVRRAWRRS